MTEVEKVSIGGYDSVIDAIHAMSAPVKAVYHPDAHNVSVYSVLFSEYRRLHDYFGRGENDVMKRLKALKHSEHNGS